MGGEFGQWARVEPRREPRLAPRELRPRTSGVQRWSRDLNRVYAGEPALHELDCDPHGFAWIDADDADEQRACLLRGATEHTTEVIVAVFNFTPVPRHNYRVGVPAAGFLARAPQQRRRRLGGSGHGNLGGVEAAPIPWHGRPHSLNLTLPPLGAVFFEAPRSETRR